MTNKRIVLLICTSIFLSFTILGACARAKENQPTADFTASPTSGPAPLTVSFNDTSTSFDGNVSWAWDFENDGVVDSIEQNTTHVYDEGVYTVSLTVQNTIGDNDTETKVNYITATAPNQPPVADASGPYTGMEGATITFNSSGSYDPDGDIISYTWDFGDGQTSTDPNPTHIYAQNGVYDVTLTVTDTDSANGTDTTTATVTDTEPNADFSATPTNGVEPLQVSFSDLSASYDGIVDWSWNFGDEQSSTEQNPTHLYVANGTYRVILTVVESDGDNAVKIEDAYITVIDAIPSANFTASQTSEALTVSFNDTSTSYDDIIQWAWDFGDGEASTDQNPTHKFPHNGNFTVTLNVTDEDGSTGTISENVTIYDVVPPVTFDDYDELWHITDFVITLNATDDINEVAQTYYKINNGLTKNVSTDGQPFITTESANNTLEYWSVDNAGNEELPHKILTGIKLDKTAPTGSITINNEDAYTTSTSVTLTLTATDEVSGVHQIRFSNDGAWNTEPWEDFSTTKAWTLTSGDGTKTVYYQIKDNAGLVSITYSDTILLDTAPPTGSITIAEGITYTPSASVTLTLFAGDNTSGIAQMRFSNDGITWSELEIYATSKSWTLSDGDGTKTVYVQFMDNTGLISQYQDTIILDTTQPTAKAGPDQAVDEDTPMIFDGSASSDNIEIASYTWTFFDGAPQTLTGMKTNYTFNTVGDYTVTLSVTDVALNSATDTVVITVIDITKPIANAGDDQVVHEDATVTFNGSGSTDNVKIVNYVWTFIDFTPQTLRGVNSTYIFDIPGVYNVTLTVSDAQGNLATDVVTITVIDASWPAANAGSDQIVDEDTSVNFDGSASSDNVGIIEYIWTFVDGTLQTMFTVNPSYTFETPGVYTVTLNVSDAEGHYTTDTVTITVLDITPPIVDVGSYTTVVEKVPVNLDASGSSDNVGIASYLWDFGDGTVENSSISSAIRIYTNPGVYTVMLTVTDEAGNDATSTISIVVNRDTDGDLIADHIDTDDDNDEISDDWEFLHGLNPLDPSDASLDFDGDGLSNLTEYQIGSNPNVYTSPSPFPLFVLLVIAIIGFLISLGILFMRKL